MTKIKFADNSKVNEYANGSLHFINNGDPIEVSEILATDLLVEKTNGVNIFERIPEDEVGDIADISGMVTTAPSGENRSDGDTDVGILGDSAENIDIPNIADDSDKTEENKADENAVKTSSRRNR